MGLSRRIDILWTKQALPEGTETAPKNVLSQMGTCSECRGAFETHAYELTVEVASCENPKLRDKNYSSIVLCERCYHRLSERNFWLATIEDLGYLVNVVGLLLILIGFIWLKNSSVGGVGIACLLFPSLVRHPVRKARENRIKKILLTHFPQVHQAAYVNLTPSWWDSSVLLCVPSALAVVANSRCPIKQISTKYLKHILCGEMKSWSELGGSDSKINLYLLVGPWREWSFIKQQLLEDNKLGPHIPLRNPVELIRKLRDDPDGIGFLPMTLRDSFGDQVCILDVDGEKCLPKNADYPFWLLPRLFPVSDVP